MREAGDKSLYIGIGGNDMTIDEAIKLMYDESSYGRDYHCQIAEWLEDYKQIKMLIPIEQALKTEYNKAIDDCIKEVEEEEKQHNHTITKDCLFWLKRKLEQLKAGGKNETDNQ